MQRLLLSSEAASAGVSETIAHQLWTEPREVPNWANIVPHFHRLTEAEKARYNRTGGCPSSSSKFLSHQISLSLSNTTIAKQGKRRLFWRCSWGRGQGWLGVHDAHL